MPQSPLPDGAVGERDRSFEGIQDRRGADLVAGPRQLIAAVQPARGGDQPRPLQLLQQLAHGGRGDVGLLGQAAGGLQACRSAARAARMTVA